MIQSLLERKVQRRPETILVNGRILFLVDDPDAMRRQLAGEDLEWPHGLPLRNNISTDEITPAYICYYFDETLGEFPYLGFQAGDEFPVTRGAVKSGGFEVSVSGQRRGKGSSREQSPYAEMLAGIRIIIAENIERIYRENCHNLGLLTSTDFSLIDKIRAREEIPLEAFTKGLDPISKQIVEFGGLFEFNVARMQGKATVPPITTEQRPMTIGEKIIARHFVTDLSLNQVGVPYVKPGDTGFVRTDIRFSHEYVTPMAADFFHKLVGPDEKVVDRESIFFFRDHLTFLDEAMTEERKKMGLLDVAKQLEVKQRTFAEEQGITLHGEIEGPKKGSEAICHSKVLESYAEPGMIIIGSDSHTPHSGAIGAVAFGAGTTAIFNSWVTKDIQLNVPGTVKIEIIGEKASNVTAKDLMLEILRQEYVRTGKAIGKILEYCGPVVEALDIDERATMTNMAAEVGAFTGLVAPDEKTVEYLVSRRGIEARAARAMLSGLASDEDAVYEKVITIDASNVKPMVALPGDPGNGVEIEDLPEGVAIDIAYGGSCTAGKIEDMDLYAKVLAEGRKQGRKVAENVTFYIQFGSQDVKRYCEQKGYLQLFEEMGVEVIEPSCGACINAGPGVSRNPDQVTISAINRNFPGRSGPGKMYLASPLTVAASALAGRITVYEEEPAASS
ncbi:MAG TPA: 3-isopropylmalate dehydratase [Planctomycetes bacterium]|nr:3-isopropylmalate dehydratase [Planctomycetota bacterium]